MSRYADHNAPSESFSLELVITCLEDIAHLTPFASNTKEALDFEKSHLELPEFFQVLGKR